ncbi:MAG: antibiotic biosynthesis monooxygenase [Rhodospirillaceae bacterium]|nr:antibiotic biosynthesis monooxygenase [Rhodospirillaceae bacterium]
MAAKPGSFVIIVEFRLAPGAREELLRLIADNANASVREEPGCRRFDVLTPVGEPDRVVLYEIYDDRAAFEAHLRTSHFLRFNEASGPLIVDRKIVEHRLEVEGSG